MERLRPGIWLLDKLMKASPAASVGRMDDAALARAQATVLPDRGVVSLILGQAQRGVEITTSVFTTPDGHPLRLRIYRWPVLPGRRPPLVVYYHGGGFALGSARQADWISSIVARRLGAIVVSVDYRLAPSHPFPAAVDDAYATACWVADHATELGGDPARIGVMGESAGGNLSAVVAIMARDKGGPALAHQALLYPVTDFTEDQRRADWFRSHRSIVLSQRDGEVFLRHYLPPGVDRRDWRISPLHAPDLSQLPPAIVVVGGLDPLHDSGVAYAKALAAAGVPVTLEDYPDMPHGFLNFPYLSASARPAMRAIVASQRAALLA
ncbi:MAG TPA: alpha/beta hydrolase [Rugosimonospora sp.]|nr:alpha/beta hydrolase [Rugosimonospora sp.]